jgi:hypothetical protein
MLVYQVPDQVFFIAATYCAPDEVVEGTKTIVVVPLAHRDNLRASLVFALNIQVI